MIKECKGLKEPSRKGAWIDRVEGVRVTGVLIIFICTEGCSIPWKVLFTVSLEKLGDATLEQTRAFPWIVCLCVPSS